MLVVLASVDRRRRSSAATRNGRWSVYWITGLAESVAAQQWSI
jgi:hypothetical protein